MKKLLISALAAVGIAAIAMPAFAVEHQFGGYWRTRAYTQNDYWHDGIRDVTQVDTRTRLYYTAKFSDNFKFVNKFEFNTIWGDNDGGDIGADGKGDWRIKNSYVDMTFCDWNVKVGIQGAVYARGLLFDDDFSGVTLTYNGDGFTVPIVWMKVVEGGYGDDANDLDVDYLLVSPTFSVNENFSLNPMLGWLRSKEDMGLWGGGDDLNVFILGLNADLNFDNVSLWFTGMYQFGTVDFAGGGDADVSAFLVAIGGEVDLGAFSIHGQTFYASGDDDPMDDDWEQFTLGPDLGQSYYWSEIMGHNTFDNNESWNSPGEYPTNIWAINLGAKFKPTEKWTLEGDLWYAMLAEDDVAWDGKKWVEDDKLGLEVDLAATYQIFDNMNIRFVAAYLFADDATGDDDPWLLGTRLEFKF